MSSFTGGQRYLGPIKLSPGVTPAQIIVFLFVIVAANCMLGFMGLIQPYVFREILHIPAGVQGRVAGGLSTIQQVGTICFISVAGVLADRIGRRAVLMIAVFGYAACLFVYPLMTTLIALYVIRFVFGAVYTGHTAGGATMMIDYPDNNSRGKFISLMLIVQGLGTAIFVGYIGARLPEWMGKAGFSSAVAGRAAFWALSALGLAGLLVAQFWLTEPKPKNLSTAHAPGGGKFKAYIADAKGVFVHARTNPRFGMVMLLGFVVRSDFVVVISFLSLWVVRGSAAQGIGIGPAMAHAGILTSVFTVVSLVTPFLFGSLADRVNRMLMMVISLGATGLALTATMLVTNVNGVAMYVVIGVIGVTETIQVIASNAVFGEEAPAHLRGSAMGIFALIGQISVIIVSLIGGILFDKLGYSAPFVMAGALNIIFAFIGFYMTWRAGQAHVSTLSSNPTTKRG